MDKELQNFIDQAKHITMTSKEKSFMYSKLSALPIPLMTKTIKSPYLTRSHFWTLGKAVIAACLIIVLGGGSLSYAAEGSLPGDLLYPIKTNVNEEIVAAVQFKQADKIAWQEKRVERRLKEIETLEQKHRLNDQLKNQIEKNLVKHRKNIEGLKKQTGTNNQQDEIKTKGQEENPKEKIGGEEKPKQKKLKERDDQKRDDIDHLD
jgi:hypothetical protein